MRCCSAASVLAVLAIAHGTCVFGLKARQVNAPIPPLEWIQPVTTGTRPPPLSDAIVGVDTRGNKLLVFGGRTPSGSFSPSTYILDMDTLVWSQPTSSIPSLNQSPSARAMAVSGFDIAANYRNALVMYGGLGPNGALADLWLYNFEYNFWFQANLAGGGPGARYGGIGGSDPTSPQSTNLSTTFYIAGGSDGSRLYSPGDVYSLVITGTLAQNDQAINTQWSKRTAAAAGDAVTGQATTVMAGGRLVTAFGCPGTSGVDSASYNAGCATQRALSLSASSTSSGWQAAGVCPAGRFGASAAPNLNTADTTFASQVFVVFGDVDETKWSGTSREGEVDILNVDQGTWTRVLPDGDKLPKARHGASVISHASVKVNGQVQDNVADTIVFGGVDGDGNFLNDLWYLRAWPSVVEPSAPRWNNLSVEFIDGCSKPITPTSTTVSGPTTTASSSPTSSALTHSASWEVAPAYQALTSVSVAVILGAFALVRIISSPSTKVSHQFARYAAGGLVTVAYVVGVIGFALGFSSMRKTELAAALTRRAEDDTDFLPTAESKAGFAIFLGLYVSLAVLGLHRLATSRLFKRNRQHPSDQLATPEDKSVDTFGRALSPSPAPDIAAEPVTPPSIPRSGRDSLMRLLKVKPPQESPAQAESTLSSPTAPSGRSFEVVRNHNRDSGVRLTDGRGGHRQGQSFSRILADIDWMERRRSINAVGELDYALTRRTPEPHARETNLVRDSENHIRPRLPTPTAALISIVFHAFLLAACVFTIITLHEHSPMVAFVVFLVWCTACYITFFVAAWKRLPRTSILATIIDRSRQEVTVPVRPELNPLQGAVPLPSSGSSRGPYPLHQPSHRVASTDDDRLRRGNTSFRPSTESHESEEMGDDEHQLQLEREMGRRDLVVLSVPRSRLFVTNND